ncbi:hypothetical protein BDR26DRAFT_869785 [Obelidium mucronatum]|nr:hypothetical protein BDR26DRAFT_869785 [Obelidium mucronatum]
MFGRVLNTTYGLRLGSRMFHPKVPFDPAAGRVIRGSVLASLSVSCQVSRVHSGPGPSLPRTPTTPLASYRLLEPLKRSFSSSKWSNSASLNPIRFTGRRSQAELDPAVVLYLIIGINTVVFVMWQVAYAESQQGNNAMLIFMRENFMSNWESLEAGRWWTTISCAFSHSMLLHFGLNMFVLHSFGRIVMGILGPNRFLMFYLTAGAFSSTVHLIYTRYIQPATKGHRQLAPPPPVQTSIFFPQQNRPYMPPVPSFNDTSSHGASGSISGFLLLYALTFPMHPITLFFFIEVPSIVGIGGYLAYDFYMASSGKQGLVDSAGHVGGGVFGAMYWFAFVKTWVSRGRF